MSSTTTQCPNWNMKADYVETCNCDYGCSCNFSGFPTGGFCNALVLYHITKESYGQDINLDGLDAIYVASWPKAIHEGDGTLQLFKSSRANEERREHLLILCLVWLKGRAHSPLLLAQ